MKIRIKDNSVRFRLTQSEVTQLGRDETVVSATEFVDRKFVYAIELTDNDEMSAAFTGDKVVLHMPKLMAQELAKTDRVGFEGESGKVKLLIEKDFVCLDNTEEDQSDNYPHPNLTC